MYDCIFGTFKHANPLSSCETEINPRVGSILIFHDGYYLCSIHPPKNRRLTSHTQSILDWYAEAYAFDRSRLRYSHSDVVIADNSITIPD